jgi:hypothetical protein
MVSINTRQAPEQFIVEPDQAGFHVPFDRSKQLHPPLQQPRHQEFGEGAFIPTQFSIETLGQLWKGTTISHIRLGQTTRKPLALIVDHQMELEAVEPIHRILAALGQPGSVALMVDAAMVTDHQLGRINTGEAMTRSTTGLQIGRQWREDRRDHLHEAALADQTRKVRAQVDQDVPGVERFEIPKVGVVKVNQDRHDFAFRQLAAAQALDLPAVQ